MRAKHAPAGANPNIPNSFVIAGPGPIPRGPSIGREKRPEVKA
jgi:hypothetical protein